MYIYIYIDIYIYIIKKEREAREASSSVTTRANTCTNTTRDNTPITAAVKMQTHMYVCPALQTELSHN